MHQTEVLPLLPVPPALPFKFPVSEGSCLFHAPHPLGKLSRVWQSWVREAVSSVSKLSPRSFPDPSGAGILGESCKLWCVQMSSIYVSVYVLLLMHVSVFGGL